MEGRSSSTLLLKLARELDAGTATVIYDEPLVGEIIPPVQLVETLGELAVDAQRELLISTPYFIPHEDFSCEILLELIKAVLESGEDVMISGFGRFCVKEKAKRRGRNPATGKDLIIAPRKVITFKWSGKLNIKPKTKAKKRRVKSI